MKSNRIDKILDFEKINKKFNIYKPKPKVYKHPFYHIYKVWDLDPKNPKPQFFDIAKELYECLIIDVKPAPKDQLFIHIRSGDTFTTFESKYIQPPLNYYRKIIEDNKDKYKKITIVTEKDNHNPVARELKKIYKNINVERNEIEDDYRMLLSASNIVIANSTFSVTAVYLSPYIKNLFLFEGVISDKDPYRFHMLFEYEIPDYLNCHVYNVENYFKDKTFDGREEIARRILINHPLEYIKKK